MTTPLTCLHCGAVLHNPREGQRYCSPGCKQAAYRDRTASQSRNTSPTQAERVLRALRRAGERGLTAVDFGLPHVVDGGEPVTRLAARVLELREQGHTIVKAGRRNKCAVYKLVEQPAVSSASATHSAPIPQGAPAQQEQPSHVVGADETLGTLFELEHRPANAIQDDYGSAA